MFIKLREVGWVCLLLVSLIVIVCVWFIIGFFKLIKGKLCL